MKKNDVQCCNECPWNKVIYDSPMCLLTATEVCPDSICTASGYQKMRFIQEVADEAFKEILIQELEVKSGT